jgi:alpha-L-fucosidase
VRRRDAASLIPAAAAGMALTGTLRADPQLPLPADLSWWREARFGMFVHWGPVSLRGTEIGWSRGVEVPVEEYDALYRRFDPTLYDARAWARLARDAGMGYLVLTTKHHDGFCLWPSALTDYDIASTPFGRDVVRELADACRAEGIVFCVYHSICDWRHRDYPLGSPGGRTRKPAPDMERYVAYLKGQVAELLHGYGPLGILWFDGEWEEPWTEERGKDLYRHCRTLQPSLIVNNRVAKGRQDMAGTTAAGTFGGDYDTPEQQVGSFRADRPWESCITICRQWAWKPGDEMKTLEECVRKLVACAGGDGNLLLNVGPMPTGEIEARQAARLREIGDWLKVHGESVYGTRGGPFKPGSSETVPPGAGPGAPAAPGAAAPRLRFTSTRRQRTVYVHVFEWPAEGPLVLPALERRIVNSSVVGGGLAEARQTAGGTEIRVAPEARRPIDTVVRLELDGPAGTLGPR